MTLTNFKNKLKELANSIRHNNSITQSLTIWQNNLEKLTSEQIAIATNKNWTLA